MCFFPSPKLCTVADKRKKEAESPSTPSIMSPNYSRKLTCDELSWNSVGALSSFQKWIDFLKYDFIYILKFVPTLIFQM